MKNVNAKFFYLKDMKIFSERPNHLELVTDEYGAIHKPICGTKLGFFYDPLVIEKPISLEESYKEISPRFSRDGVTVVKDREFSVKEILVDYLAVPNERARICKKCIKKFYKIIE
jgi:hypothetical protein